ncbi:site-specific DNA-methyltransferase [Sporolactobacillus shoreae]|uniref:Site-specific DNA-methyltransferase n=1 Tax=Sporolactobacillus shoreae TaxID=1465501 RepID=A0A4Z0GJ29_9BACL|nr:site-specific DNA-methyltransferase [Sporolactobacillus shoreae]TGA95897.1 site-specific DNA-methyltransferase [Sporolactobacillus shoreae]
MPRGRKKQDEIDGNNMREIETYEHKNKKRSNNPPVGMGQYDKSAESKKKYEFDPYLDPTLQWAGKAEGMSFDVPTSSIHIHESIKPHKIIRSVQAIGDDYQDPQLSFFETPVERMRRRREAIEFYRHGVDWTNRLIAGDSLVIMNSLLEKEGMARQVQMVFIDPPYGIKYGSNFQPFVGKRDVKDRKDEDLTQEPEMIKAFRDTWELGIHSYLTYLRNRLLLVRELLADSGSVFIQISDENLHHVRELCDEIFGATNFISIIPFRKKTMPLGSNFLERMHDYLVWYGKDAKQTKYHQLFNFQNIEGDIHWGLVELPNGERRKMTNDELNNHSMLPKGSRVFRLVPLWPVSFSANAVYDVEFNGKTYKPPVGQCWVTNPDGMRKLIANNRIMPEGDGNLRYVYYLDDYPLKKAVSFWDDTVGARNQSYVVQTAVKVIQRCIVMTTDPGDLVLDITCGSGTTAYAAEQWGRRWITCDTSRVAIVLAKQRLMTATFDYYKLAHPGQGVGSGFIYRTIPRIALKTIANGEPPAIEVQYDQPEIDKTKARITGPFTVEALPAPVVKPLDAVAALDDISAKQADWRGELLATGIRGRNGAKIEFSRVEPISGTKFLQAEAETKENTPRRAAVCFGSESKPLDSRMVSLALDEAENLRPKVSLIIFAAFQFDPEAAKDIDETSWPGITMLKVQMNTDLMTEDLKKKRSSNESFWLVGQPDVELLPIDKGKDKGKYKVRVNGFDYYNVKTGTIDSGNTNRIAMWMLDTDYDGLCIEPMQVFFPMSGKKDGWNKLAKTLRAEINQDLIGKYAGNESLPFKVDSNSQIAVKIIDDRGIESLKVIKVGEL